MAREGGGGGPGITDVRRVLDAAPVGVEIVAGGREIAGAGDGGGHRGRGGGVESGEELRGEAGLDGGGEKMVRVLALVRVHGAGYRAPRLNVRIGVIVGPSQLGP